jgi:hypothetical protein
MRRISLTLSLLALVAVPLAARADTDLITITGAEGTYTFTVASSPTVTLANSDGATYFDLTAVPTTFEAAGSPTVTDYSDTVYFFDTVDDGALADGNTSFPLYSSTEGQNGLFLAGVELFTEGVGGILSPTFNAGASGTLYTLNATGVPSDEMNPTYTYSIVDETSRPPSVTPEPSSLILLGTGALGLAGTLRRRIFS